MISKYVFFVFIYLWKFKKIKVKNITDIETLFSSDWHIYLYLISLNILKSFMKLCFQLLILTLVFYEKHE